MAFVSLCGNLEPSLHPCPYSHSSHLGSRSSLRVTSCPCWPGIAGGERGSWNAELPMLKLGKSLANQDGCLPLSSLLPTSPRIQLVPLSDLFSTEQPERSANLVMSLPCWKAFEWPPSIIKAKPFNPASEVFFRILPCCLPGCLAHHCQHPRPALRAPVSCTVRSATPTSIAPA